MKSENPFPGGVWPVMLTPYTEDGLVDYHSMGRLVNWYIKSGVSGLFAVCQSSEMFSLSIEERISIARHVVETAAGRVPVIASGHVSVDIKKQADELNRIADTGVDAVILITNRLATEEQDDNVWLTNLGNLLGQVNPKIPLGLYECPFPYKRLLSLKVIEELLLTNRFYFLKDTCCNLDGILAKQALVKGSKLRIYNANTATLLPTLRAGVAGYSGVMANFHPELYVWLCKHIYHAKAETLHEFLSVAALIERQAYPVNAKFSLKMSGVMNNISSRVMKDCLLDATAQSEVIQLMSLSQKVEGWLKD